MFLLFSIALRCAGADTNADLGVPESDLIPDNTRLWTESMLWDKQITLSSGVGYNNNVLLSPLNTQGSGFFINSVDLAATRLPLDGWQVVAALVGDDTRYWRDVATGRADSFLSTVSVERELPGQWRAGLEVRGLYEHEVLDISSTIGAPQTALVDGFAATGQPYLRKDLPAGFWAKLQFPVTRWFLAAPLDDYWDFGPGLTLGWTPGVYTEITLTYAASFQQHDQWQALDAYGMTPLGRLQILQHQAELAWRQYWDSRRLLHSATRLVFDCRQDNGQGYFNYYQYQAIEDLHFEGAGWKINGGAQIAYEFYPVQGIGILNGNTLHRALLDLTLDVERQLYRAVACFARVEYQKATSNDFTNEGDYKGTTVSGGLRVEF